MIHKPHDFGKRKSSTGVADYFAVLGIDSFLPDGDHAPEEDGVGLDTPRNGNLSSCDPRRDSFAAEGHESVQRSDGTDRDDQHGTKREEQKMYEERFNREIIELALVSSTDLDRNAWSVCEQHVPQASDGHAVGSPLESGERNSKPGLLELYGNAPLNIDGVECGGVQLVYKRRGQVETNDASPSNYEGMQPNEGPAVADVAIHYVKVHPFAIPNYRYTSFSPHQSNLTQQFSSTAQSTRQKPLPISTTAAAVAQEAARTLSSLARRTTGLTAKGKEIVGELPTLANVVKGVRGASAISNGVGISRLDGNAADEMDAIDEENPKLPLHHWGDAGKEDLAGTDSNSEHSDIFEDAHGEMPRLNDGDLHKNSMPQCTITRRREHFFPDTPAPLKKANATSDHSNIQLNNNGFVRLSLSEMIPLPNGFDEWITPDFCDILHLPSCDRLKVMKQEQLLHSAQQLSSGRHPILLDRTHVLPSPAAKMGKSSPSSMGVEAMYISPMSTPKFGSGTEGKETDDAVERPKPSEVTLPIDGKVSSPVIPDPTVIPTVVPWKAVPTSFFNNNNGDQEYVYIPILAIRRQRTGEEERFHEDPAIVDVLLSRLDLNGMPPPTPIDKGDDDYNDDDSKPMMQHGIHPNILKRSSWLPSGIDSQKAQHHKHHPIILVRRNLPNGLADVPFPARVLDRFPQKNYREIPFPEEELPMFCYAKGSLLVRDRLRNLPMPKCFGFVVKNERGDSIYVSCLSFLEPLTTRRKDELDKLSMRRQETSLPHRIHFQRNRHTRHDTIIDKCLVGFDDVVTFECKTLCLVGRYPFWTAFRCFLTHLHLLSGSSSDIPLERHISHLLLSVPLPKPGGQCVLIPMSTMREPMALVMPPSKDLPLLDLSYKMLFSALDVPTVVTIVLGFLCLEKKVILTSTRQSLVLDCCELLKSLIFPFDLCAPYVPHLTAPFMSCLEFPGATFVGIHDDCDPNGLANTVRRCIPEDSIVVELDSGEIRCDGNRYETLKAAYQIIPSDSRSVLVKEVEFLCQSAGIVPGQEPLDYGVDSAIDSTVPSNLAESFGKSTNHTNEPLDDRAIRDCFLRFFCSILGGYERFLVVPDADFLISGNDWFDSSKFLAAAPSARVPFLRSLVETQLFQSFIQRRTEASDVHCVLFDECLVEYHSSKIPHGLRGNGDLLVDQCATELDTLWNEDETSFIAKSEVDDKSLSHSDTATQVSFDWDVPFALNSSGDIVTIPSVLGLPANARFVYCVDGLPSFPTRFNRSYFLPKEPESLSDDSKESHAPILTRSEREREEALRSLNMTISRRGPQKQHRCLWQLPKFMGSQVLGTWLLCIPFQLSQPTLSLNEKSKVILRALGAFRTLRSHRRIIADEAAYRALIVACGKCGSDRRVELMKLYGLMRSDGIFPNAVTLGQYTRAIAEGFSRRSEDIQSKIGMQISTNGTRVPTPLNLDILDSNLQILEDSGQKWRSHGNASQAQGAPLVGVDGHTSLTDKNDQIHMISPAKTFDTATTSRSSKQKRSWLPVTCSSSFVSTPRDVSDENNRVCLVALWSRAATCDSCQYTPLDEEIQSGWDVLHSATERSPSIACPRCGSMISPLLGFKHLEIEEALGLPDERNFCLDEGRLNSSGDSTAGELPPQLEGMIRDGQSCGFSVAQSAKMGLVTYFSPYRLRLMLEQLLEEYGEEGLTRDCLLALDPQLFYNLWWYCARFSLPLPLATVAHTTSHNMIQPTGNILGNCWAFASWDKSVAMHGCQSAARAIAAAKSLHHNPDRALHEKLFDNPNTDIPILSFFNLQNYAQADWDHPDLNEILVTLVKACETRDLFPVVECILRRNLFRKPKQDARTKHGSNMLNASFESSGSVTYSVGGESSEMQISPSVELDCYRTILYLARYHCLTAFHVFFPTFTKACKGYHFWCAQGTPWSIFDRAFREAAQEYGKKHNLLVPLPDVADVAIGFRCVFGHII
ncbi:hypothetical protein HJC23_010160 [Cyclotella cryptica]|uniref:UDENN domain-containing protein n=1 Tax=Cyclotella cryptica TaxID=29204 RepID=A0ABD3P4D0_9STRA|eukprot:CCRYP_017848-RB/>CCRYP_017848-RB protein AED:0.05 eAED:0.05 QI:233/1/1/1/0.5/0.28/7/560/1962